MLIDDVPDRCPVGESDDLLQPLLDHLGPVLGGLVAGIARPGSSVPDDTDRAWHESIIAACRRHDVPLLGTYFATPGRVTELPVADELVA